MQVLNNSVRSASIHMLLQLSKGIFRISALKSAHTQNSPGVWGPCLMCVENDNVIGGTAIPVKRG